MKTLGNILWFVLGGFISGTAYFLLGVLFCLTIVGIPIGKALFQYAKLMYFPFGKVIVRETFVKGAENVSGVRRIGGTILNIIWFPLGFAMMIVSIAQMLVCFVSIICIPVGVVIAKSSKFLLWPIGAKVITQEEYQAILTANIIAARNGGSVDTDIKVSGQNTVPMIIAATVLLAVLVLLLGVNINILFALICVAVLGGASIFLVKLLEAKKNKGRDTEINSPGNDEPETAKTAETSVIE